MSEWRWLYFHQLEISYRPSHSSRYSTLWGHKDNLRSVGQVIRCSKLLIWSELVNKSFSMSFGKFLSPKNGFLEKTTVKFNSDRRIVVSRDRISYQTRVWGGVYDTNPSRTLLEQYSSEQVTHVGIRSLAESNTALCSLKTVSKVERKMTRSGNRVVAPKKWVLSLKVPGLKLLQWAYSPQALAAFSTMWPVYGTMKINV